jgi:hypothetical protein
LSWKLEWLINFSTLALQNRHSVSGSSDTFWKASKTSPHLVHWYS